MNNRIYFSLLATSFFLFSSCATNHNNLGYERIIDQNQISLITNYNLEYKIKVPGNNGVSYNVLWTGYDEKEQFPYTPVSKEDRQYTYLTSYPENSEDYYLIYMTKQDINKSKSWLFEYEKNHISDINNYHFLSEETIIDGKYLLFAQKNSIYNYDVYHINDLSKTLYSFNKKQLVCCLQAKKLTIVKNVSTGKAIDKDVMLLRRVELKYDSKKNKVERYTFDNSENSNVKYIDNYFSFSGRKIETYPLSFEDHNYIYCPYLKTAYAEIIEGKAILPHFAKIDDNYVNLLDDSFSGTFFQDDIFRDFKPLFRNAFIEDITIKSDQIYKYAFFDYNEVENIIFEKGY